MSPIGGTSSFSFNAALQYQDLTSGETPQQLQTAGVISIPDAANSTPASSVSPSEAETSALISSLSTGSTGLADPTELAGAYQLLSSQGAQTVQVIGDMRSGLGQQVDAQV
jgi:hypothetical protein